MKTKLITLLFFLIVSVTNAQHAGKTYYIESAVGKKYLDVAWAKTQNGTPLHLWQYNGKVQQKFTIENAGGDYFYIKSALGKYLHIKDRSSQLRALVHIWSGKGNDNTKWKFIPAEDGYYYIQSKKGNYLDVKMGNSANGTPIWMWQYNGENAQKWKFIEAKNNTVVSYLPNAIIAANINETKEATRTRAGVTTKITPTRNYNGNQNNINVVSKSVKRGNKYCTSIKYDIENASSEDLGYIITTDHDTNIYPGAIYKNNAFIDGSLRSPQYKRIPYNITIDLVSASSGKLSNLVGKGNIAINFTSASQAITEILKENKNVKASANNGITLQQIDDTRQLKVAFGANISALGSGLSSNTSYEYKRKKKTYVGRFFQRYYTIKLDDYPELIDSLDIKNIKANDVYISEVAYGRIGYVKIVSDSELHEVQQAFDAKVNAFIGGGSTSMSASARQTASKWSFIAYTTGGNAQTITSIQGFLAWARDARWNPNVSQKPIGYKLKYLKDNLPAYIVKNTSFTRYECRNQQAFKLTFLNIGYSRHNKDDCSRIYANLTAKLNQFNKNGDYVKTIKAKKSRSNKLVEWDNRNSGKWGKKQHYAVANNFKLNASTVNQLKAERKSLTFYVDPNLYDEDLLQLDLGYYFKSCHKDGNGISGWNCNVKMPNDKPINKTFRLKSDLLKNASGNRPIYFDSGMINGSQRHQWKVYYKLQKL